MAVGSGDVLIKAQPKVIIATKVQVITIRWCIVTHLQEFGGGYKQLNKLTTSSSAVKKKAKGSLICSTQRHWLTLFQDSMIGGRIQDEGHTGILLHTVD